ncbi:MAG: hypothetical protein ACP5E4_04215 [Candidatus Aenigmatarchaeota archaeon]
MELSDSDRAKLEKELIRDITPKIEKRIEKKIEERMRCQFLQMISKTLDEECMPPEKMFRKEFVEETERIVEEIKSGKAKTYSFENLQKAWKKEHEVQP